MTAVASSSSKGRYAVSGVVAGGVSTVVFTIIHDIFISDIWFSLIPMLAAGALCWLCVAWSYALLVSAPSGGVPGAAAAAAGFCWSREIASLTGLKIFAITALL